VNGNNRNINNAKWIDSLIVLLFFAGVLLFLFYTGTLNSGYHFIDDHEMLKIHADLEKTSFVDTTIQWIKNDFNIRFRPIYFLHRVFEMKFFGDNFFDLSFYTGVLAALTFLFFYYGARKMRFSILESVLFIILTFIGPQMAIWWQLGPNETIGMFFLGLSFLYMAKCTDNNKYFLNNSLFSIFLILASLSKENFAMIIPAFVLYKTWNEKQLFKKSTLEIIQKNYLAIFLIFFMIVEMWFIVFLVGTNTIGYAGSTSSVRELFRRVSDILIRENMLSGWLKLTVVLSAIYFSELAYLKFRKKIKISLMISKILPALFFSLMVVLPNILFYAKSGFMERYLLPIVLGFSFFAVNVIKNINNGILRKAIILICILFSVSLYNTAAKSASIFAKEGFQTAEMFSAVIGNSKPNSSILLVADPVDRFETSDSIRIYLSSKGFNNMYAHPIGREYRSDFERNLEKIWMKWFEHKNLKDMNNDPGVIILIDKIQSEQIFIKKYIPQNKYHNILDNNNPHAVYVKNNP